MQLFQITIIKEGQPNETRFIKTEASPEQFQKTIDFVKQTPEYHADMVLPALRALGFKSTEVKLEPTEKFEF